MSTLFFSHKRLVVVCLLLAIVPSCRKDIDFEQSQDFNSQGAIDSSKPILEEWEFVNSTTFLVQRITSDGEFLYYFQGGGIHKMDTSGSSTLLFNVTGVSVNHLTYDGGKLYFTEKVAAGIANIHEFDETGILNTYTLNVSQSYGTEVNTLIDLGTELFVAGKFNMANPYGWNACLIDKATGVATPMAGLGGNPVKSSILFNNEIHIVGTVLFGNNTNSIGHGLARWNGNQWIAMGKNNLESNSTSPPYIGSIGSHNGQLILGGGLTSFEYGVYRYSSFYNNFYGDQKMQSTATSLEATKVVMKMINGDLYACGDIRFVDASFNSVYVLQDNAWRSIGALRASATDFTICQGYAYAIVNGRIKKCPL